MAVTAEERNGLVGTVVFHLVLLILFLLLGLTHMVPAPMTGIPINFGTSDNGMGEVQPDQSGAPEVVVSEPEQEVSEPTPAEASTPVEKVMTQETVEAVHVPTAEEKAEKKRKEEEAEQKRREDEARKKANALASVFNNPNGGNEGETHQPGDQGSADGSKEATSHTGGGDGGKGVSHTLSNRTLLSTPKIVDSSQDEGKVVVDIIVDRNGKVIKATPGAQGSTTTSPHLYKKAKEAALKTEFSANTDVPTEQRGQMIFVFILE